MQRVRMSLPFFSEFGWDAEVVAVDPVFTDMQQDMLLTEGLPQKLKIHWVRAFDKKWTCKIGLGSLALRSLLFYLTKVNGLLKNGHYDLIYFSTTQFPVCVLGAYWKQRFGVPYVIDMQDPWHSDYYKNKPKAEWPRKYWFSYRLNKLLEPWAIRQVNGLISVSDEYIVSLKQRYPVIKAIPAVTIPFGAYAADIDIAASHSSEFRNLLPEGYSHVVYVGRGGADMHQAIIPLFKALQEVLKTRPDYLQKLRFCFIGTSYAPAGTGIPTIVPLAKAFGLEDYIIEVTDRISYYHALYTLRSAKALFIPGADSNGYTPSKLYPYLLLNKPILGIFSEMSPAISILHEYGAEWVYTVNQATASHILDYIDGVLHHPGETVNYSVAAIEKYSARQLTASQSAFFDRVINEKSKLQSKRFSGGNKRL